MCATCVMHMCLACAFFCTTHLHTCPLCTQPHTSAYAYKKTSASNTHTLHKILLTRVDTDQACCMHVFVLNIFLHEKTSVCNTHTLHKTPLTRVDMDQACRMHDMHVFVQCVVHIFAWLACITCDACNVPCKASMHPAIIH